MADMTKAVLRPPRIPLPPDYLANSTDAEILRWARSVELRLQQFAVDVNTEIDRLQPPA